MDIFETKPYLASVIQFDVKLGSTNDNVHYVLKAIEELSDKGVQLVVLPEMWTCGFDNVNIASHAKNTPEILNMLSQAADNFDMVIAGSMPEYSEEGIFNTLYVINADGAICGTYRKIHLFRLTDEHKYYLGGTKHVICQTAVGDIGVMICYDLRFPELCRTMALKGAQVIVISAQWPTVRIPHWDILVQARAIENQVFVIAANRCGFSNNLEYGGHSYIISPWGNILAAADKTPCVLTSKINYEEIQSTRSMMPCFTDRVPEAYE